jgi:group II intron reverse transcriptase/maturase
MLDTCLPELLSRAKSGAYRAPPVRRVHIPKERGKTRPIGIPTHEDKVLQRSVAMVLEPVFEQEFCDFSYGFRPGRSAHDALASLWHGTMKMGGGWVLDVDVSNFFDSVDHRVCRDLLARRVRDGVITRLVGKWLRAGVLEKGAIRYTDLGTPQGGVISPLLANIYLHYVLDEWWAKEVQPRLRGQSLMIRYADDLVMVFERERDARRVKAVLASRIAKYGLSLHPEKTRLLPFGRPPSGTRRNGGKPASFDFLGFTHYWGKARNGRWVVKRKTMCSRQNRAILGIDRWCRKYRHLPVVVQARVLGRKLRGHYAYYGVTGNIRSLRTVLYQASRRWRKWLSRRSQRARIPWARMLAIMARHPLPEPTLVHSVYRLAAKP